MNLSRHFTLAELTFSSTAASEHIANVPDAAAIACLGALCNAVLDPLRDALGLPITISSGYRGPVLNQRVGGVPDSQHVLGMAADVQAPGLAVLAVFQKVIAIGLPFDQIIYEAKDANTKWVHVSHHAGHNRGEIRVARFAPNGKPTGYPAVTAAQALAMTEPASRSARTWVAPVPVPVPPQPEVAGELALGVPYQAPAMKTTPASKASAKKAPATKAVAKQVPARKTGA